MLGRPNDADFKRKNAEPAPKKLASGGAPSPGVSDILYFALPYTI